MNRKLFLLTLVWAVVVALAVHFLEFRGSVRDFARKSEGGTLFDVKPSFSEDETYARLRSYGPAGRENYAFRNVTVDIVLPLSVLPFLVLLARRSSASARMRFAPRVALMTVPFAYVVFDLAENGAVLSLLSYYPDRLPAVAAVLPYLTLIKRIASLLALALPLAIFAFVALRRPREMTNASGRAP